VTHHELLQIAAQTALLVQLRLHVLQVNLNLTNREEQLAEGRRRLTVICN
jgi:hypothetical protein